MVTRVSVALKRAELAHERFQNLRGQFLNLRRRYAAERWVGSSRPIVIRLISWPCHFRNGKARFGGFNRSRVSIYIPIIRNSFILTTLENIKLTFLKFELFMLLFFSRTNLRTCCVTFLPCQSYRNRKSESGFTHRMRSSSILRQ